MGQATEQLGVEHQRAVLARGHVGEPERAPRARHNGELLHLGLEPGEQSGHGGAHQGVPHLVARHRLLLRAAQDGALLLDARIHALRSRVEVFGANLEGPFPACQEGRLVDEIREVGAGEACRLRRHRPQRHAGGERQALALDVHAQDLQAALAVRKLHGHTPVEAARAQESGVKHVRAVGRGNTDDEALAPILGFPRVEAVHLDKQLVESLLALVIPHAPHFRVAPLGHCVNLVDEHDGGRLLPRIHEELAHARGAHAHVELHELAGRHAEEGHPGLPGHGLRQQRFARAGRPHQQEAGRGPRPDALEALGVPQVLHDLF